MNQFKPEAMQDNTVAARIKTDRRGDMKAQEREARPE